MSYAVDTSARATLRIFLHSGLVWQLCWSSYWTLFFLRVVLDVGLDPLELLLLGTTKEITILLVEIPTGVVADIRSRRLSVILSFFICGVAIVGAGLADTFVLLVVTQAVWAFGSTFRSGAETAWFTDEVGSLATVDAVLPRRGRYEAAGSIVGVAATAALAALTSLSASLVVVGGVLVLWGLVLSARMPETGFIRHDFSARDRFRQLLGEGFAAARRPGLRVLLAVTVATGFASEAVDRLSVARLDQVGLQGSIDPVLLVGGATVAQSLGVIIVLALYGRRMASSQLVTAMLILHAVTALGVVVLARSSLLAAAVAGIVLAGTARSVARTVTVGWTNHFTDQANRATVHSFVGQCQSLGEIAGGIVLGLVARQVGIAAALTASAIVYLLASGWTSRGRKRWSMSTAGSV